MSGIPSAFGFLGRSIPRRIMASLAAIYAVTYVATALVVYSGVHASIVESRTAALHQLAERKYERLSGVFDALATDLTAWSRLEVMNDLVSGDLDKRVTRTLEELKSLYGLSGDIYAFDAAGTLVTATRMPGPGAAARLPAAWMPPGHGIAFVDRHRDPLGEGDIVALAIPVFGSFDPGYRVGTLALTCPWREVEALLFSLETGTMLVEPGARPRVLAADRADGVDPAALDAGNAWADGVHGDLIVGRSAPRDGLLGRWQVLALERAATVAQALRRVGLELAVLGAALAVPILALGRWLSRRLTAPVVELTRVVREIADTDRLGARVPVSSADELGTLARSFNRMTESLERAARERDRFVRDLEALNQTLETKVAARTAELEQAVAAQQRLLGDISHEIKSPLARLGVALGLVRRAAGDAAPRHLDRMEREIANVAALAGELLTIARLDGAAATVPFERIDLRALVAGIVADAAYEAPERAGDLRLDAPAGSMEVDGNADLLRRAIENVVRNAIFYTAPATPVRVVLAARSPQVVTVEVHDEGPGVPETALAHLFEPFYRVDAARARNTGGSGVGLTICQRVVALHHGTALAWANRPNGLIVAIELPVRQPRTPG